MDCGKVDFEGVEFKFRKVGFEGVEVENFEFRKVGFERVEFENFEFRKVGEKIEFSVGVCQELVGDEKL